MISLAIVFETEGCRVRVTSSRQLLRVGNFPGRSGTPSPSRDRAPQPGALFWWPKSRSAASLQPLSASPVVIVMRHVGHRRGERFVVEGMWKYVKVECVWSKKGVGWHRVDPMRSISPETLGRGPAVGRTARDAHHRFRVPSVPYFAPTERGLQVSLDYRSFHAV